MPTTMPRRRIRRRVALNCARPIRVYGSSLNARTCSDDCRRAVRIVTMVTIARRAAAVATGWVHDALARSITYSDGIRNTGCHRR